MMKYSDFIKGNEDFQFSINIQYDLGNMNKVQSYIPTKKSIELLYRYLLNTQSKNSDKATILVGPYGKGKSHLLLILLSILCEQNNDIINELLTKIDKIDPQCAVLAKELSKEKKYLPIVMNFNSNDLTQALLIGINDSLARAGISDILPKNYFESAIDTLENWRGFHEKTIINNFIKILDEEYSIDFNDFIQELKAYSKEAYGIFNEIFTIVTAGIQFNPMTNTDIVSLINELNIKLKESYNYDGMVIIFDEFSKFIESTGEGINTKDLKILQDIAELSARSNNPQMHFICVTHKAINEYISRIPQNQIDAWRTIEGRFKEIYFVTSSQQNYELISNATKKDNKKLNQYLNENRTLLDSYTGEAERLFSDVFSLEEFEKNIVDGCFPLHPYSTYALPIISEKVAQNERTLFTFLSKDEHGSLINLVNNNNGEFNLITLDVLYDYFETLFKKDIFNKKIYDIWIQADTSLKLSYNELEKKIIKTLAIIYIINNFNDLEPNEYTIKHSITEDSKLIDKGIESLVQSGNLMIRKGSNHIDFFPISSVNITQKINDLAKTRFKEISYPETFESIVKLKHLLPKRYNDEFRTIRFFKRKYMTAEELVSYSSSETLLHKNECDGLIVDLVLQKKEDKKEVLDWLRDINDNRILLCIPQKILSNDIKQSLSQLKAIEYLKNDQSFLNEDKAISTQLDILGEDLLEKVTSYIFSTYNDRHNGCCFVVGDKEYKRIKDTEKSNLLSDICKDCYPNTPIINNEMINRNSITSMVKKSRDNIVKMLLNEDISDFNYMSTSLDSTIFRTTLINQNVLESDNIITSVIKDFIINTEDKQVEFKALYDALTGKEKGIGLRRGVIPIYLSLILHQYKDDMAIYRKSGRNKKEVLLSVETINNINDNPEDYLLSIDKGTKERKEYLDKLELIFGKYCGNNTDNQFVNIVEGMQSWVQSLCLFAKNARYVFNKKDEISKEVIRFRTSIMKYEINYREFLLKDLFKILMTSSYEETCNKLLEVKNYLDLYKENSKKTLINEVNSIVCSTYKGSLSCNLQDWYSNLENYKKEHLFSITINEFLKFCSDIDNNDISNINKISKIMTGLYIEDWNDNTIDDFLSEFKNCFKTIQEYKEVKSIKNDGTIRIILNNDDQKIERTFNKVEVSQTGILLKNALEDYISDFGDSIDDNEKRNILMELMQKYI